jgi:hypothetical protein
MLTPDDLSTYLADLLCGTYDCADRISLRGYFPLGQTSGGLLTWWNQLFPNTPLSQQRLRTLAGDFARRVNAYASKHKIPLRYFAIGDKTKHAQAEKLRPADPRFKGVFAIFVAKARVCEKIAYTRDRQTLISMRSFFHERTIYVMGIVA